MLQIKAFTTWTCDRCGCKESTGAAVNENHKIIGLVRPPDWARKSIDREAKHFCPVCSDIIEKALKPCSK